MPPGFCMVVLGPGGLVPEEFLLWSMFAMVDALGLVFTEAGVVYGELGVGESRLGDRPLGDLRPAGTGPVEDD